MANLSTNTSLLQDILNSVNNLPEQSNGLDTSDANASSSDILLNKTAYVNGEKITGTIPTKTSSNLTASGSTVTVPSGYYSTAATKSVSTATQATPSISVNSSGLITASATQTAGYVAAGTKSATKQLTTQAGTTITPGTASKTAVASGRYTTGTVYVKGDSNLVAGNIKSGISIFGVSGTLNTGSGGSSGGNSDMEDGVIARTISVYTNNRVTSIGSYTFYSCKNLTSVSFPKCTTINIYAFQNCPSLTSVNFPECTTIGTAAFYSCKNLTSVSFPKCTTINFSAFHNCPSLTSVNFPKCTTIGSSAFFKCASLSFASFPECTIINSAAFHSCPSLTSVSFPKCTSISNYAFQRCSSLTSVYLLASTVCTLANSNAFTSTSITSTSGSIFVPTSLVTSYKAASNWSYFSNRIFAYTEHDTGAGE